LAPIKCEPPAGSKKQPDVRSSTLAVRLDTFIAAKAQHAIPKSDERTRLFRTNPSPLLPLTRMLSTACGYLPAQNEKGGPQAAF
jgi:hypothetical protein